MKKSTLLNYFMWGYQANMDGKEYDDLKNRLVQHEKEIKANDASVLAESVIKNFPEFQIMNESFIRSKVEKISNGVNTIKIIMVVYVIASVIIAIAIASQIK